MAKLLTLFTLLPKAHQITLSLLVMLTAIILMFPSEDAQASKQTGLVDKSNAQKTIETNTRYAVPLAFRTPSAPGENTSTDTPADNIFNDTTPSQQADSNDNGQATADDEAFAKHLALLQTRPNGVDGLIGELESYHAKK